MLVPMILTVLAAAPAPEARTRVFFARLEARGGITADAADTLLDVLAREVTRRPGFEVVTYKEAEGAMEIERMIQRAAAGTGPLDGRALLNASELLTGSVERLGDAVSMTVARIRVADGSTLGRANIRAPAGKNIKKLRNWAGH